MIKVCHMTSVHAPEDGRIFFKECTSSANAGYETYLVERGATYDKNGVHIVGVGDFQGNRLQRMLTLTKRVYETALKINAEIYHIHDPELLPYALKLKKKGKKVIFDSHEYYSDQIRNKPYLPKSISTIIACIYKLYENYVCKRIDAVIFPCLKNGIHPFQGKCKRVITLNNVPMLGELYDHYDPKIEKYPNSICYIGGLTENRGITEVIKAAYLSNTIAYIAGIFSPVEYQIKIESMPESSSMRYLGNLDRKQVLELLQRCKIGLATLHNVGQYNQFDNLATKCYEYMALGIPVILTKAKYNEKINEIYKIGLCVDAENEHEIADAIRYLLDHEEEAKKMGENGRKAIREVFNWEKEKDSLLNLYINLRSNSIG